MGPWLVTEQISTVHIWLKLVVSWVCVLEACENGTEDGLCVNNTFWSIELYEYHLTGSVHVCVCSPSNPEGLTALWVGNVLPDVPEKTLLHMFSQWEMLYLLLTGPGSCNAPWFIRRYRHYIYCLFAYLISLLSYLSTSFRIGLFPFPGHRS